MVSNASSVAAMQVSVVIMVLGLVCRANRQCSLIQGVLGIVVTRRVPGSAGGSSWLAPGCFRPPRATTIHPVQPLSTQKIMAASDAVTAAATATAAPRSPSRVEPTAEQ
jgi:hypothetical protein